MRRTWAVARMRCPRCYRGPIFKGLMSTRERCPACDLRFEREPGYFIGAMYASYAFGFVSTAYWFPLLLLGVSPVWVLVPPIVQLFAQIPVTYRYSRAIWLHVDRGFDPDGSCGAGSPSPGPRP